ncbi:TRAP transporter substrate-binding protein [Chloroflexota bacterium]
MKKLLLIMITTLVVSTLIFGGCANTTPVNAPTKTPTTAPTVVTPKVEPIELTLNLPTPPIHLRWRLATEPWTKELEKRTGGRVKIIPYHAEALSPQGENYDSVVKGIADMGECSITIGGYKPGRFPYLEEIGNCATPSVIMSNPTSAIRELYDTFPEIQERFNESKVLFLHASVPNIIGTTSKSVSTLEDIKGLKLNNIGGQLVGNKLTALGASPVGIPFADFYMAAEKGVVDGGLVSYDLMVSRKWGDVIKNVTPISTFYMAFYMVMNKDKWNSLPPDIQQIIEDLSGNYATNLYNDFWWNNEKDCTQKWESEMGGTTHVLAPQDLEKVDALLKPVTESFVDNMEAKGLQFRKVYNKFIELEKQQAMSK